MGLINITNSVHEDLKLAESVYSKYGFYLSKLKPAKESLAYAACSFQLNEKKIAFRVSKITPTKPGQFVSIWKRNGAGLTVPFDASDEFDFLIISSRVGDNWGQFIFPKSELIRNGVISKSAGGGKRGIRVYTPWDKLLNRQAEKTQSWQIRYFLALNQLDIDLHEKLNRYLL